MTETMTSNSAALWYFESVDLFKTLCPHKTRDLGTDHAFLQFQKDEFVYFPEEKADHIFMVAEGRVKVGHYLDNGKEVVKSILSRGEIFGELALADEDRRTDFAQALDENTIICPLSLCDLKSMMAENKELSLRLIKLMGLRLMKLERKLELLVFKDARTRVIEFLKDAAAWKGRRVGSETMIPSRLTHRDIAALTATSRQTVTTILNELKCKNLIYFDRRKILIRDIDLLQ